MFNMMYTQQSLQLFLRFQCISYNALGCDQDKIASPRIHYQVQQFVLAANLYIQLTMLEDFYVRQHIVSCEHSSLKSHCHWATFYRVFNINSSHCPFGRLARDMLVFSSMAWYAGTLQYVPHFICQCNRNGRYRHRQHMLAVLSCADWHGNPCF